MMTIEQGQDVLRALSAMVQVRTERQFADALKVPGAVSDNLIDAADELAANDAGDFALQDALRPAVYAWVDENRAAILRRAQELADEDDATAQDDSEITEEDEGAC